MSLVGFRVQFLVAQKSDDNKGTLLGVGYFSLGGNPEQKNGKKGRRLPSTLLLSS